MEVGGRRGQMEVGGDAVLGNKMVTNLLGEWWDGTGWWCFGTVREGSRGGGGGKGVKMGRFEKMIFL